jgi:hypothetical protein
MVAEFGGHRMRTDVGRTERNRHSDDLFARVRDISTLRRNCDASSDEEGLGSLPYAR